MSNRRYFTELTRVQIPAILHLTRIGYTYFGKISEDDAGIVYDSDTNILLDVFKRQFALLNPKHKDSWVETLRQIKHELDKDSFQSLRRSSLTLTIQKTMFFTAPVSLHAKMARMNFVQM